MSLRKKTFIMTGTTFAGLVVILYAVSRMTLLGAFAELQESYVRQNLGRALRALSRELTSLESVANDWASWDDTYAFMVNGDNRYIESNLVDGTFTTLHLNLMLFVDESGRIVFGRGFDIDKEVETPLSPALEKHLAENGALLRRPQIAKKVTGIILLPEGPMLVASQPVLTSEEEGPARGRLIMGRYLDAEQIAPGVCAERAAARQTAIETARIAFAPSLPLLGVPSRSISRWSICDWALASRPPSSWAIVVLMFSTASSTPLPM